MSRATSDEGIKPGDPKYSSDTATKFPHQSLILGEQTETLKKI